MKRLARALVALTDHLGGVCAVHLFSHIARTGGTADGPADLGAVASLLDEELAMLAVPDGALDVLRAIETLLVDVLEAPEELADLDPATTVTGALVRTFDALSLLRRQHGYGTTVSPVAYLRLRRALETDLAELAPSWPQAELDAVCELLERVVTRVAARLARVA